MLSVAPQPFTCSLHQFLTSADYGRASPYQTGQLHDHSARASRIPALKKFQDP
jgi:hypothetical protein